MEINGIIYKITNCINGKIYIGQTHRTLDERWKQHLYDSNGKNGGFALHRALRKYGVDNFKIEEIDSANTVDELNFLESYWIEKLNTMSPNGYNLVGGGFNNTFSDEAKRNVREGLWKLKPSGAINSKGVSFYSGMFHAKIKVNNKDVVLGNYKTLIEAEWAYDEAVRKYHDGKGYLNMPNGPTKLLRDTLFSRAMENMNKTFGLSWDSKNLCWLVTINFNGKTKNLGRYKDKFSAMCVYDNFVINNKLNKKLNFNYRYEPQIKVNKDDVK